jgi:hypothetical protein
MTGALYSLEQIERVRREFSLVAMVAKRLDLKRAGRRWSGLCPFHGEKTPSFTVGEGNSGEFYHCFGCGAHGDLFDWLEHAEGWNFGDAMKRLMGGEAPDARRPMQADQRPTLKQRSDFISSTAAGRWIWRTSGAARGEIVEQWLKARKLDPLAEFVPGHGAIDQLRFHPRCPLGAWRLHDDPAGQRNAPAMVAPFVDPQGLIRGVHVTWLTPDGSGKALLPKLPDGKARPQRKMFGKVGGCAVMLTPFSTGPDAGPLLVGEGIETTWSYAQELGRPCRAAAALSLENLQGHALRLKGGALPLWALKADPERPPFLLEDPGEVIILVDADMKPLRDMRVQDDKGEPPIRRDIGGAERAAICAQLATQFWRRAGATRVERVRPPMGLDFNDAQIAAARAA